MSVDTAIRVTRGDQVRCGDGPIYKVVGVDTFDGFTTLLRADGRMVGLFLLPEHDWKKVSA